MNYTQAVGDAVELKCITRFIELGYEVSIPYGNGAKYDFIVDLDGKFLRVQCKSSSNPSISGNPGKYDTSAIQFSASSQTTNTQKTVRHTYSKEQIDYFATWYNNQVYLIPVEECSVSKTLRFSPPKNNSSKYNKAEDYEIEKVIPISQELLKSKEDFENRREQSILENQKNILYCSSCGEQITKYSKSGLCSKCYSEISRKVERPNREELKLLIRNKSFLEIGRIYNVSDNAIRKWCRAELLPTKKNEISMYSEEEWDKI